MTATSERSAEEDACYCVCVFYKHIQKGIPGLTHKECILQHVSSGALSDVITAVLKTNYTRMCDIDKSCIPHATDRFKLNTKLNIHVLKCVDIEINFSHKVAIYNV